MPWLLKSPLFSPSRRAHPSLKFLSQLISSHKQSTQTHPTTPLLLSSHEQLLLSLLLHHQPRRHPSLQVHSQLLTTGLHQHHIDEPGVTLWNTLIRHYSHGCSPEEAIYLYKQMLQLCAACIPTDTFTFSFLLKGCAISFRTMEGEQFHSIIIKKGFELHVYVHTALVDMYAQCGSLEHAKKAFDEMTERNSVTWNALITGLAKWGELSFARSLFDRMPDKNVISWTGMINAYAHAYKPMEAMALFVKMMDQGERPTEITILAIIPAIWNLGALDFGESAHAYCEKKGLALLDVRVMNSFIDMYAKCGSIENSYKVFEEMSNRRTLVSWTSIISGFAMHGMANEAMELFKKMSQVNVRPNRLTFLSVLNACCHGGLVKEGMRFFSSMVYEYGIEPEIKHYGCMIDMLGRAGRLEEAEKMIEDMPMVVNVVVWRTLLGGCSKHGDVEMGKRVMKRILELERVNGADYVVLSNMLTEFGRFTDAERVRGLIVERNVVKVPGLSSIGGKV